MYIDLEDNLTKKYYKEIVEKAILIAKETCDCSPNNPINISFYNQLLDIKNSVIDNSEIYTKEEAYKKYPMAVIVTKNFIGEEGETDYAKMLKDIVWGISLYPNMSE
ncbi:hypothetical protein [Capnocytophaga stomatis]|uniref:Uncharacterized protein n=1 Tax=Capnocytophaga stomatis TaxID=1848904 RepID=A0ABW8QD44_9FLAO|nr:hypothetical protein [Capnocytophaga stomatis]GIM49740.1 hypothetical protein CAPN003_11920 [Capnocytophaga stomatis]